MAVPPCGVKVHSTLWDGMTKMIWPPDPVGKSTAFCAKAAAGININAADAAPTPAPSRSLNIIDLRKVIVRSHGNGTAEIPQAPCSHGYPRTGARFNAFRSRADFTRRRATAD